MGGNGGCTCRVDSTFRFTVFHFSLLYALTYKRQQREQGGDDDNDSSSSRMTMMLAGCHRDKRLRFLFLHSKRREERSLSLSLSLSLRKILEILLFLLNSPLTPTNTADNRRLTRGLGYRLSCTRKRYREHRSLLPLNDCCRTSYRHASRFRTVAGSSSYALGSAFGTVRRRSDATGALLATQVPASGKSHDLAVEPRDQPILPLSELLSFSLSFLFFSPFFHAHRSLFPAEYSVFTKGGEGHIRSRS